MRPSRGDHLLTTPESARMIGVRPATIRKWRQRGYLAAQGLDELGRPLHTAEAVRAAELEVRQRALATNKTDPRRLRVSARNLTTAA